MPTVGDTCKITDMSIGRRISHALTVTGMSQSELARRLGIQPQSVQAWCDPEKDSSPRHKRIKAIADILGVDENWIFTGSGTEPIYGSMNVSTGPRVQDVPLISWVQAGKWAEIVDEYHPGQGEAPVYTTKNVGEKAYALRVRGDSMENPRGKPTYPDGCLIIVDPDAGYSSGSRIVVRLEGASEATFKQYIEDGGRQYLKPLNPQYPMIEVNGDMTYCGTVVQTVIDE